MPKKHVFYPITNMKAYITITTALLLSACATNTPIDNSFNETEYDPWTKDEGIHYVDIDRDGEKDDIVSVSYVENMNAHSYFNYSFSINDDHQYAVNIAPEYDSEVSTHHGADCVLRDYRLILSKDGTFLLKAEREFGDSYADSRPVTFTYYQLVNNYERPDMAPLVEVGVNKYSFEETTHKTSFANYCDVNIAINEELNLNNSIIQKQS